MYACVCCPKSVRTWKQLIPVPIADSDSILGTAVRTNYLLDYSIDITEP